MLLGGGALLELGGAPLCDELAGGDGAWIRGRYGGLLGLSYIAGRRCDYTLCRVVGSPRMPCGGSGCPQGTPLRRPLVFDVTPAGAIGAGWPAAVLTAGDEPPRYIFPSRPRGVRRGFAAAPPRAIRESPLQRWWRSAGRPAPAHGGMKKHELWFGTVGSAAPRPDPSGGQAPALHFPDPRRVSNPPLRRGGAAGQVDDLLLFYREVDGVDDLKEL